MKLIDAFVKAVRKEMPLVFLGAGVASAVPLIVIGYQQQGGEAQTQLVIAGIVCGFAGLICSMLSSADRVIEHSDGYQI